MAKKLALQQIEWNCSTIQFYEGTPAARADVVNRARDQFFAGPCFSMDKNRGIRGRNAFDLLKYRFERSALSYDLLKPALITIWITEF
jgi:hypothetical protein